MKQINTQQTTNSIQLNAGCRQSAAATARRVASQILLQIHRPHDLRCRGTSCEPIDLSDLVSQGGTLNNLRKKCPCRCLPAVPGWPGRQRDRWASARRVRPLLPSRCSAADPGSKYNRCGLVRPAASAASRCGRACAGGRGASGGRRRRNRPAASPSSRARQVLDRNASPGSPRSNPDAMGC